MSDDFLWYGVSVNENPSTVGFGGFFVFWVDGEMSNQIQCDLIKICDVARRLNSELPPYIFLSKSTFIKIHFKMAKQKLFISFTDADMKKVEIIEDVLRNNPDFKAEVVARKNTPGKSISG